MAGLPAPRCLDTLLPHMFARGSLVPLVAVSAVAVAGASASSTPTITVGPGDTMAIQGSDIHCVISTTLPRAIVCGIASQNSTRPHSYAITVADKGVAIFAATGSQQVVAREINPAISGPPNKRASHKPTRYVLAQSEHVLLAGTHVECATVLIDKHTRQTIGCGVLNESSAGYFISGSYAGTLSDLYAGILRAGKNGAQTVLAVQKQP